jgi:hypothetical protein
MENKNRKELPRFGYLTNKIIDIDKLIHHLSTHDLLDWNKYNDIKVSADSVYSDFVKLNAFSKDTFFKESNAAPLEGDSYVQLYLTDFDEGERSNSVKAEYNISIFSRTKRLSRDSDIYSPEADELNYGIKNKHAAGILESIIDSFSGKITRVRLACLKSGFEIKPHIDYDPSYITRFHIPIITNESVRLYMKISGNVAEYHMPADGRIYFFNSGLVHWVKNNSEFDRLHLIVDVHGQQDLENLEEIIF